MNIYVIGTKVIVSIESNLELFRKADVVLSTSYVQEDDIQVIKHRLPTTLDENT